MMLSVFCILLFAALLHASWNAIIKAGNDKPYSAIGVSDSAVIMVLIRLPFMPQPSAANLSFLTVSTILQIVYTALIAKTCQVSDMSQTYPLMRGTAPLLVATIGVLFLGDNLSVLAQVGIATICLVILGMASNECSSLQCGIVLTFTNACSIIGYMPVDGTGVRLSKIALGYTLWAFFLNDSCLLDQVTIARCRGVSRYLIQQWGKDILGEIGVMGLYDPALWTMAQVPLAVVVVLHETSIPFSALFA